MRKQIICALVAISSMTTTVDSYAIKPSDLKYTNADTLPLIGTLAPDAKKLYSRLPDSLENVIRKEVWNLGQNSAGLAVRFRSDASSIGAEWKSVKKFRMNHMTATGIRGLDLYVYDNGEWTTLGSARPSLLDNHNSAVIMTDMKPEMREYMLYLSLYDGVDSLRIGVDSAAVVLQPELNSPQLEQPIIMYGTSIMQGGCATRPGMCHSSIIERKLNRQVINLGFSGNAKLDIEIAQLIASVKDPGVIVIDPLPNLKTPELIERMPAFYKTIRDSHPQVPILLVESPIFPLMRFNQETLATVTEKNKALRSFYDELIKSGDKYVSYFEGEKILGDCVDGTIDNYHMTDLGFTHFANSLAPVLKQMLMQR